MPSLNPKSLPCCWDTRHLPYRPRISVHVLLAMQVEFCPSNVSHWYNKIQGLLLLTNGLRGSHPSCRRNSRGLIWWPTFKVQMANDVCLYRWNSLHSSWHTRQSSSQQNHWWIIWAFHPDTMIDNQVSCGDAWEFRLKQGEYYKLT
jgi:hypothetical protein